MTQCFAPAHDLTEAQLALDLVLKVELLPSELVLQFRDLAIGEGVVERRAYLAGNLLEQFKPMGVESVLPARRNPKDAEDSVSTNQREAVAASELFSSQTAQSGVVGRKASQIMGNPGPQDLFKGRSCDKNRGSLPCDASALREVENEYAAMLHFLVDQNDCRRLESERSSDRRRDGTEEGIHVEVRQEAPPHVQNEAKPLIAPCQLRLRDSKPLEVRGVVHRERHQAPNVR